MLSWLSRVANAACGGLLLLLAHLETLLGGVGPRKVSLDLGRPQVRKLLTGNTKGQRRSFLRPRNHAWGEFVVLT
jgi:hypothetical protein